MKLKTNFDVYLKDQLQDVGFEMRFKRAAEAWHEAINQDILRHKEKNPINPVNPVEKIEEIYE